MPLNATVYDINEFARMHFPPRRFYVENLLTHRGKMIIFGSPGVRKSWLVQHLAFCISTGEPWVGFRTRQARVLFANFDETEDNFHDRVTLMLPHFNIEQQMCYEVSPGMVFLEEGNNMRAFVDLITPVQPNVIIMDCMQSCYGKSEIDREQVSPFLLSLFSMQRELNAAIVMVHHSNKNPLAINTLDKMRGSTLIPAWMDTVVYMAEQPSGVQLQFPKHRHSRVPLRARNVVFQDFNWQLRNQGGNNEEQVTE